MKYLDILSRIRDADYHEPGIRCLQLFWLDPAFFGQLRDEVLLLCLTNRPSDVTQHSHITNWTKPYGESFQFSLLNSSGRYDDTSTDHNQSCLGKRFHEADIYPTLARFIACFPHCINFRLNVMGPRSGLSPHEEHITIRLKSGAVGIKGRFHLPVVTNLQAEVMLEGDIYHLYAGMIYFFNNGCIHAASNMGDTARLHLVWDMLLTCEACEVMLGQQEVVEIPMSRTVDDQTVQPLRRERVGQYERLPRLVSRSEAAAVGFSSVQ